MINTFKVFLIRLLYRMQSAFAWRADKSDTPHSLLQIPSKSGPLGLRMYVGEQGANKPLIVYFHGGGWVIGDLVTHHPFCQQLCANSGCSVVSLDYRLAPEHPYPAAHDDCLEATRWIATQLNSLAPNSGRLILAGDSAGANLASCTHLALNASEQSLIAGEILIYPVTDYYTNDHPSYHEKGTGYALTSNLMRWFWDNYLGKSVPQGEQPPLRTTPLHATNLASAPATFLVTAQNDPLRDEGIAYAKKLAESGVSVQTRHFDQAEHGFACSQGCTADFRTLMTDIEQWIEGLE